MFRYDIEIEAACLRAAATAMAAPNYQGDPADPAAIARLAKQILAAYYTDAADGEMPAPSMPDVI
ncbi:hypothetical protein STVA_33700 [Allostella vacuolata]|nr:hypothetical protein STVA_33700 [Stella vacuolata]